MTIKETILGNLRAVLHDRGIFVEPTVEYPSGAKHGDYSSNVALVVAKKLKRNPLELAEEIAEKLRVENKELRVEVVKPGFINFWVNNNQLVDSLSALNEPFSVETALSGKKLLIEFAHPNTHKEMHIGHMRTLITGESIARLAEAAGADVCRANYQGDIGPHVAKAMYGIQELMKEMAKDQGKSSQEIFAEISTWSHNDKAHFLGRGYAEGVKLYDSGKMAKEIDETNAFLYQKCSGQKITSSFREEEQEKLWNLYEETRKWSLDYYNEFYKRFYTTFKKLFFERDMVADGMRIVREHVGKVFEKNEDTIIFPGEKYGLHTRVFITAKGYPTYEGKEMANAFAEYKAFAFDKKIHVVANEQAGYFKVVFKALELIDPEKFKERQYHLSMGMVQLKDRKMSSRTGDVLTVDWLLDQIRDRVSDLVEEGSVGEEERAATIEKIVIGAVKYSVLKVSTAQNAAFDIETSVSLEGNSGPYIQYTYARTQSVLSKAEGKDSPAGEAGQRGEGQLLAISSHLEIEERQLLRLLARFPEVVEEAAVRYAPHILCTYLFDVAQSFNVFYQACPILKAEQEKQKVRLFLTASTGNVLKEGLRLLGIQAPEQM